MDISSIANSAYNKFLTLAEEEVQEEAVEGEEEKGVEDLEALDNLVIENGIPSDVPYSLENFKMGSESSHGAEAHAAPAALASEAHAAPAVLPSEAYPDPAVLPTVMVFEASEDTDSTTSTTMDQMTNDMTQAELQQFNNNMVNSAKSELSEIQAEQKKEWQTASDANSDNN